MKKAISTQSIIILISTALALIISLFIGKDLSSSFYVNTLLINLTFIGDAFFAFGIVFFLQYFFHNKKKALSLLMALVICLVTTQFIKNLAYGSSTFQIFFEAGVINDTEEILKNTNIISSHTAVAFTLAGFFILNKKTFLSRITLILIAILVAYSRVVLVGDSIASLFLGVVPAIISFVYLLQINKIQKAISNFIFTLREKTLFPQPKVNV